MHMSEYKVELSMGHNSGIILWNDYVLESFSEVWPEGSDRSYIPIFVLNLVEEWVCHDRFSLEREYIVPQNYAAFGVMISDRN